MIYAFTLLSDYDTTFFSNPSLFPYTIQNSDASHFFKDPIAGDYYNDRIQGVSLLLLNLIYGDYIYENSTKV